MGLKEDKTITDIVQAVRESDAKKTKGYDTQATVTRVEDGKAWVHIPGGVPETPVELTINAQPGDSVMVRLAGGRAFLLGNVTSPPTDDATAKEALSNAADALQSAVNAKLAADSAEASAATASAAAQDAVETAEAVHGIAEQAQADAETAKTNAQTAITNAAAAQAAAGAAQTSADNAQAQAASATASANGALNGLSTVQDVIGVLDWAKDNATYTLTSDPDIVPGKTYWTRSGSGTSADPYVYTPVVTPVKADLGTYYEISGVDEAMADYINTHLALTDEGLYVLGGANQWKVLIAPDGVYIIDGTSGVDKVVAKYKDAITLGESGNRVQSSLSPSNYKINTDSGTMLNVGFLNEQENGALVATIETYSLPGYEYLNPDYMLADDYGALIVYGLSDGYFMPSEIVGLYAKNTTTGEFDLEVPKSLYYYTDKCYIGGSTTPIRAIVLKTGIYPSDYWSSPYRVVYKTEELAPVFCFGTENTILGSDSVVIGKGNYTNVPRVVILGQDNICNVEPYDASYGRAIVIGYMNEIAEPHAGVIGENLIANARQIVMGHYNKVVENASGNSGTVLIIGGGISPSKRANALEVTRGGEIKTRLDSYQTSGNVDKTIYDALNSLGWLSDCVES